MAENTSPTIPGLLVGVWPPVADLPPDRSVNLDAWEGMQQADFLELRWDLLFPIEAAEGKDEAFRLMRVWEIARAWKSRNPEGSLLFTIRLERDGGRWPDARAATRHAIWRQWLEALDGGAPVPDWLDVELETFGEWSPEALQRWRKAGARFLASHHSFARVYSENDLEALWDRFQRLDCDGLKWALQPGSGGEWRALAPYLGRTSEHYAMSGIFCMGQEGRPSRLAAPWMGCPLTYGYFGAHPAAPGQLPMVRLAEGLERMRTRIPSKGGWTELWHAAESILADMDRKG